MNQLLALACIVGFTWYAWPAYRGADRKALLIALVTLFPIVAWIHVTRRGIAARNGIALADTMAAQEQRSKQHRDAVEFCRWQLVYGTPVEAANALELLAMWNEPVHALAAPPLGDVPLIITHEGDHDYLTRLRADLHLPLTGALPSGRVLTRADRERLRRNGLLYLPDRP